MPGARRTRSLVCAWGSEYAHEYSQRGRQNHPASPRNGLRLIARSSRRSGCLASVARGVTSTNLTPASRRQNHASSPSASVPFVIGTSASTASRPAFVTIASRPFGWDETVIDMPVIWGDAEPKYFLLWDSTAQITQNLARRADQSAGSARQPGLAAPLPAAGMWKTPERHRLHSFLHSTNQASEPIAKHALAPLPLRSSAPRWQGSLPDRSRDQPYAIACR